MSTDAMMAMMMAAAMDSAMSLCGVPTDSFGGYGPRRVDLGKGFELSVVGHETCLCKAGGGPVYVSEWNCENVRHWSSSSEITGEIERLRDLIVMSDGTERVSDSPIHCYSSDNNTDARDSTAEYKAYRQRRKRQRAAARRAAAAAGWTPASVNQRR